MESKNALKISGIIFLVLGIASLAVFWIYNIDTLVSGLIWLLLGIGTFAVHQGKIRLAAICLIMGLILVYTCLFPSI